MAERRVPRIRFKGFEEDWEQRKLGEICSELRSGEFISAEDITEYGAIPVYGGNGLRGYTSKYNREGEFALIGRQGALCGNMNFSRGKAYFTEHAVITQANSDNDTLFLFYCCDNMNLGQYSDQSAQPGLAVGKLAQLLVRRPCKIEQEKIAKAMSVLDSLLSLHQRKLEKLKILKKAMLEKIFPKNGAKVPEIRFSGFTDDWEQRKLGELAFITTGKLDANAAKKDGEYNFFTCGKEILKTNSYAFDGEAILINGNGDLGYTRKYVGKFNTYQRTYVLQGFVMDYEYIEHAIHKFLPDRIKNESIGGAMPYIKIDSLMNLELPIPVVQEAVAVTRFLNELDSLLSLHHRQCLTLAFHRIRRFFHGSFYPGGGF